MKTLAKIKNINKIIINTLKKYGVTKIILFGSYARKEQTLKSDIDIIVEFSQRKSLLELIGIEQELTEQLGIKVDLLTEKFISPYILNEIRKNMKVIYKTNEK